MGKAARRIAVFLALAGALILGSGSAIASSGTGTQNPALTVSLTVTNAGGGADGNTETATDGEMVTASVSVTNNTTATRTVVIRITAQDPDGASLLIPTQVDVGAGQTVTSGDDIPVQGDQFVLGTYEVTLSAQLTGDTEDASFPSVATATISLV
jgi:hypothetical protein